MMEPPHMADEAHTASSDGTQRSIWDAQKPGCYCRPVPAVHMHTHTNKQILHTQMKSKYTTSTQKNNRQSKFSTIRK